MSQKSTELQKKLFSGLDYASYIKKYGLDFLFGYDVSGSDYAPSKIHKGLNASVDPARVEEFAAELDDLCRLHYLVTNRKATCVLEFGVGKSTIVFDEALKNNMRHHSKYVRQHLRRDKPFTCYTVDDQEKWVTHVKDRHQFSNVEFTLTRVVMGTFGDRICTFYENLPNVCPDLIYLDGPDQFSAFGDVRGISTRSSDRLPMAADILAIEHFLLPGTLIVVDGRTANARFLKCNLQREWTYFYSQDYDQHFFELSEAPLGRFNNAQMEFSLNGRE